MKATKGRCMGRFREIRWTLLCVLVLMIGGDAAAMERARDIVTLEKRYDELYAFGDIAGALIQAQRIEAAVKKLVGSIHPDYAVALKRLAAVYVRQGRNNQAEAALRLALPILEKAPGPNETDLASTLTNLAFVYRTLDRPAAAEPLSKRVLTITERSWGPNHPLVAEALIDLGKILSDGGQFDEAAAVNTRALAILERAFGPNHPKD
jgi:tetratricopeptide (TPR) repeat protein